MQQREKERKNEKIVGYVLLIIGLILILLPAVIALWYLVNGQIPRLIMLPASGEGESVKAFAVFTNACMIFFIFIVVVWAGSIVSTRGVTMIKDVKLKLVRKSLGEAVKAIDKQNE